MFNEPAIETFINDKLIKTKGNEDLVYDEPEPNEYLTADDLPILRRNYRINDPFDLNDEQIL